MVSANFTTGSTRGFFPVRLPIPTLLQHAQTHLNNLANRHDHHRKSEESA
jgi:hypothetical protein